MSSPTDQLIQKDSLVLYKTGPAHVIETGTKLEIELENKTRVHVRNKDITLLHPGPLANIAQLKQLSGEIAEARKILEGETTTLADLAELIYGSFTPSSAWAVYQLLQDGLHFYGTPDTIYVRSQKEYENEFNTRHLKAAEKAAWDGFIKRVRQGTVLKEDQKWFIDLENLAYENTTKSRILKELKIQSTPQNAHKLLIRLNLWDHTVNPYIRRLGFSTKIAYPPLEEFPAEERLNLTHLEAFAIDDEGNEDPDDAISIDADKLWVHIADVAAVVKPDTPADVQARSQGANLYLPEQTVTMLPPAATGLFALGLKATSPALSFCISLNEQGGIENLSIHPTLVKVTRISYLQAEERLNESPFKEIHMFTEKYEKYRKFRDAIFLELPEVKIRVKKGIVCIRKLPELRSKQLVMNAMLMAGEAAAKFAIRHQIPIPFTTQPLPQSIENPRDLAAMFAYRKQLKPSQIQVSPGPHACLGLESYSRTTSPLRRYVDLVTHQQIRAFLKQQAIMDEQEILNRIGTYTAIIGSVQKLERLVYQHWTLVYFIQNPDWQGTGVIVEKRGSVYTVLIPGLAMETRLNISQELALNTEIQLRVSAVDLPDLITHFKLVKSKKTHAR